MYLVTDHLGLEDLRYFTIQNRRFRRTYSYVNLVINYKFIIIVLNIYMFMFNNLKAAQNCLIIIIIINNLINCNVKINNYYKNL